MGGTTRKIVLGLLLAGLLLPASAQASFPGANGRIAFATDRDYSAGGGFEIYTMDADGTSPTRLTDNTADDFVPAWSPDGSKIAFERAGDIYTMDADGANVARVTNQLASEAPAWSPDGSKIAFDTDRDGTYEIYAMDADGTNPTRLTNDTATDLSPAWSPDGTKIAFVKLTGSYEIYTMNADGTNQTRLTNNTGLDLGPDWSPDGSRIAFVTDRNGNYEIYTMDADGTNPTRLTINIALDSNPAWSPDGTQIAFQSERDSSRGEIYTMNADGTSPTRLTSNTAFEVQPDWQPIPVNTYPRPKGATPLRLSLVPAYQECTTPNSAHGTPLLNGSCAPPQLASTELTVGTPDSNGKFTGMNAYLTLQTIVGNPTPEDDADVRITARANDVFTKDLSDYSGSLRANLPITITDRSNTPSPGGAGAGTTAPFALGFDVPCTATTDVTIGSDCTIATTVDTLYPGAIVSGKRAIWQMGRGRLDDAGPDGDPATLGDNTVFAVQGVFVP